MDPGGCHSCSSKHCCSCCILSSLYRRLQWFAFLATFEVDLQAFWLECPVAVWTGLQHAFVPVLVCCVVVLFHQSRFVNVAGACQRSIKLFWQTLDFYRLFTLSDPDDVFKAQRSLWTWLPLLLWQLFLFYGPLLLTCFQMYRQTLRSVFAATDVAEYHFWTIFHFYSCRYFNYFNEFRVAGKIYNFIELKINT